MAEVMYLEKNDVRLRNAMVEVYKRKCFYCGRALDVNTLEVDHILPKNGKDEIDPVENPAFQEYISELTSNGFRYNSITNYLPSCGSCNKKKGNKYFTIGNLRYFHEYADRHRDKLVNYIKKMIYTGVDEKTSKANLEIVRKYTENNHLSIEKVLLNARFYLYYVNGLGMARIDSYLPTDIEDELNCLLMFGDKGIENCMITFNEEDILKFFFSGVGKGVCEERQYIVYMKDDEVCVQFPRIRIIIKIESAEQMATLFDDLYFEFNHQRTKLINTIDASEFIEDEKGIFRMIEMPVSIWRLLKDFTYNHDYMTGDTEWDIFSSTGGNDTIYIFKNHMNDIIADVHVVLILKQVSDNRVVVSWKRGFLGVSNDKMANFDNIVKWTVKYTHDWLLQKWIPYVLYLFERDNDRNKSIMKFFGRFSYVDFAEKFSIEDYDIQSLSE